MYNVNLFNKYNEGIHRKVIRTDGVPAGIYWIRAISDREMKTMKWIKIYTD